MAQPEGPNERHKSEVEHVADEVFSSEKREDIWAIIIAAGVLLVSVAFPDQVHYLFSKALYLF